MTKSLPYIAFIGFAFLFIGYVLFSESKFARADSTSVPATVATSSTVLVGTSASLLFSTSTCVARTISTASTSLMLGWKGITPTAQTGFWQATSTTVTYDASQFGCGAVFVYSNIPAVISVQESR